MKRVVLIATHAWLGLFLSTQVALAAQVCGNGIVESPETCDDGNTVGGDSCPATCGVDSSTLAISAGTAAESNGTDRGLGIRVDRTGTPVLGINLGLRTVNGTAHLGEDFEAISDSERYYLTSTGTALITTVPLIDDLIAEMSETFNVELYGAYRTGGITLVDTDTRRTVNDGPWAVVAADFDNDGDVDVVTAHANAKNFGVLRNTSSGGTVSFDAVQTLSSSGLPYGLVAGDFDGDGLPDLASANYDNGGLTYMRNVSTAGGIQFGAQTVLGSVAGAVDLATADFDGDGKLDVVGAIESGGVFAWRNTSTGAGTISFSPIARYTASGTLRSIAVGDFNGDGKTDVAVTASSDNKVLVLANTSTTGTISFGSAASFATGTGPSGLAAADFDGDGLPDLAVSNAGTTTVSVLRNTSSGGTLGFATQVPFTIGAAAYFLAAGDVDGDTIPDIVASSSSSNKLSVLLNTSTIGTVSFAGQVQYTTGTAPQDLVIADISGDAQADVVVANNGSDNMSVVRNNRPLVPITTSSAVATITDDDEPAVSFTAASSGVDESAGSTTLTVTLSGPKSQAVNVSYTLGGTATQGTDYTISPASLSFAAGETSKTLTISGLADNVNEGLGTETVVVTLEDPANGTLAAPSQHTLTITDTDEPVVSFATASGDVNESAGTTTITVTMAGSSPQTVDVSYTLGGTATQGTDYAISPATLSFAPGDSSKTITISGMADDAVEGATETIVVTLQDPGNAALKTPSEHTLTITNDSYASVSAPATLDFADQTVATTSGPGTAVFTNTGTRPLTFGTPAIGGTHAADFAIATNGCTAAVAPSATCSISVRFSPSATGARSATLVVSSNAANSPTSVALTGDGVAAPVDPTPDPPAGGGSAGGGGGGSMGLGLLAFALLRRRRALRPQVG